MYGENPPRASPKQTSLVWIVGPIVAVLAFFLVVIAVCVLKRRRQKNPKQPLMMMADGHNAATPLMAGFEMTTGNGHGNGTNGLTAAVVSDPVEMRRMNFATAAMLSHPPVPVVDLAAHVDALKANDGLGFTQEYESIDPGQQFTWECSTAEVNKAKNRYNDLLDLRSFCRRKLRRRFVYCILSAVGPFLGFFNSSIVEHRCLLVLHSLKSLILRCPMKISGYWLDQLFSHFPRTCVSSF
jgi:hypothetical protein